MKQHLMIGLVALGAAAAGPAWAEPCEADASFDTLASADCKGGGHAYGWQHSRSFDALAAAALHAQGKGLQANEHAHPLNAVPEPGTTAMLIAGVAAIAYRLGRRKS